MPETAGAKRPIVMLVEPSRPERESQMMLLVAQVDTDLISSGSSKEAQVYLENLAASGLSMSLVIANLEALVIARDWQGAADFCHNIRRLCPDTAIIATHKLADREPLLEQLAAHSFPEGVRLHDLKDPPLSLGGLARELLQAEAKE